MKLRTRISQEARERGWTAAEIARRLQLHRSNLSAMDAGRRSVSLKMLSKIAGLLNMSPAELIEIIPSQKRAISFARGLQQILTKRDTVQSGEVNKEWVHRLMLVWRRHYRSGQRVK